MREDGLPELWLEYSGRAGLPPFGDGILCCPPCTGNFCAEKIQ